MPVILQPANMKEALECKLGQEQRRQYYSQLMKEALGSFVTLYRFY